MHASLDPALEELARLHGIETSHTDALGTHRTASFDVLRLVLGALGTEITLPEDAAEAVRQRRRALWERRLPPVAVARGGGGDLRVRLPAAASGPFRATFADRAVDGRLDELEVFERADLDGRPFVERRLLLGEVPLGYHRLSFEHGGACDLATLISAPETGWRWPGGRRWGLFAPLYALWSNERPEGGDFGTLEELLDFTHALGGGVVATLPLLPTFLDGPIDPSPYAAVSRLFFNELYVDLRRAPELERSPRARELLGDGRFEPFRGARHVDYERLHRSRREVLAELARTFFAEKGGPRREALAAFVSARPLVEEYARFRGATARAGSPWPSWPEPRRSGRLDEADVDRDVERTHLYGQLLAEEQLAALGARARAIGTDLYLDLPVGVHPDGFDAWREQGSFAHGVAAGAPPDAFFSRGQDWGFHPLHPERMREDGHLYFRRTVEHHLRHAGLLRIDHLLGFHRLYFIPRGVPATDGLYVRYPKDELYAVLALESHRAKAPIVGEDLGTVPPDLRATMERQAMLRMYVMQFAVYPWGVDVPDPAMVSCLGTHDTPMFAGFMKALDVDDRRDLGLFDEAGAEAERQRRAELRRALSGFLVARGLLEDEQADLAAVMRACHELLAGSASDLLLVTLEDLWLEESPQNTPGTHRERPNWQRRLARPFDEVRSDAAIADLLRRIDACRRA
jgi:4-alpha-glucanotransferase